jgi:hypothetical protein
LRLLPAREHSARGYFAIAAATFCWGVSATLGRAAFPAAFFPDAALSRRSTL